MLFVPTSGFDVGLSPWTGRAGMVIDPWGVECFGEVAPERRGRWFRRREKPVPTYLHVLVHTDLPAERVQSWAAGQLARLGAVAVEPDAQGDRLNRLAEEESARLHQRPWHETTLVVDEADVHALCLAADEQRWAAYLEVDGRRIAVLGKGVPAEQVRLRSATEPELRDLRMAALRV